MIQNKFNIFKRNCAFRIIILRLLFGPDAEQDGNLKMLSWGKEEEETLVGHTRKILVFQRGITSVCVNSPL